jgi:hypothetical protein
MLSSSSTTESKHAISNNTNHPTTTKNHPAHSSSNPQKTSPTGASKAHRQQTSATKEGKSTTSHHKQSTKVSSSSVNGSASKNSKTASSHETAPLTTHSDSEDSYTAGGGFISEMDEHDAAFDGAMEYDEDDGRSLLGEDFDASSDGKKERKG